MRPTRPAHATPRHAARPAAAVALLPEGACRGCPCLQGCVCSLTPGMFFAACCVLVQSQAGGLGRVGVVQFLVQPYSDPEEQGGDGEGGSAQALTGLTF